MIYVEVMPTATADGLAALKRYREAVRKDDGNLRCEVVQRIGQPHQFAVLGVWKDQKAFEAHAQAAHTDGHAREDRRRSATRRPTSACTTALSVGARRRRPRGGAVYAVTHVDVIPPHKDNGVAAVKQLAEDSRKHAGNLRFEVVQQTNRPNHFTVVEIWTDAKAVEAHSWRRQTREFRDKLAPMTGALYDERMYRAVD